MFATAPRNGHPVAVTFPTPLDNGPRRRRTGLVVAIVAAALLVLAIAGTAVVLFVRHGDNPASSAEPQTPPDSPDATASAAPTTAAPTAAAPTTGAPPPASCTNCQMADGVTYRIGRAARAGQYHSDGPRGADGCAVKLTRTGPDGRVFTVADKSFYASVDLPVRDGDTFVSHGCKPWHLTATAG